MIYLYRSTWNFTLCTRAFTNLKCGVRMNRSFTMMGSHDLVAFTDPSHERAGEHDAQDLKWTHDRQGGKGGEVVKRDTAPSGEKEKCLLRYLYEGDDESCYSDPENVLLQQVLQRGPTTLQRNKTGVLVITQTRVYYMPVGDCKWLQMTRLNRSLWRFSSHLCVDFVAVLQRSVSAALRDVLAAGVWDGVVVRLEGDPVGSIHRPTAFQLHTHKTRYP